MEEHGATAMCEKNEITFMNPSGKVNCLPGLWCHGAEEMLAVTPCPKDSDHHWLIPSSTPFLSKSHQSALQPEGLRNSVYP